MPRQELNTVQVARNLADTNSHRQKGGTGYQANRTDGQTTNLSPLAPSSPLVTNLGTLCRYSAVLVL